MNARLRFKTASRRIDMKIRIGETEYNVEPITPELSPFMSLLGETLKAKPATVEEAKEVQKKVSELAEIIFPETVTPKPLKRHRMQLLQTVINLTSQVMDEADCFRKTRLP